MNTGKVALGILAGVAVGAALGILFAPDKGSVTRRRIVSKGDDAINDVKSKLKDFVDEITEKFDAMKEGTASMKEEERMKENTY
jgi:gas vesicle protein